MAFFLISLFWGFIALPGLIINDLKLIQIALDLSIFFGCLAGAYFFLILFKIFYPQISAKPLLPTVTSLGIAFLIFSILNLKPAFIHFQGNFVFWSENRSLLVNIISGSLYSVVEIMAASLFYFKGLRIREKEVRFRALLLGTAQVFIFLAIATRFIFGFLFSNIFISTLTSFFIGGIFPTLFMIIAAFFVKPEPALFYKKISEEKK